MIISVVNHTGGSIADEKILPVIRAINRQIADDFYPYWSIGAELRLEGRSEKRPTQRRLPDMRGDAIIYLYDKVTVDQAEGYHDKNDAGIPYGFVFTEISRQLKEAWSTTLSHEALELIGDPEVNLLVQGPHPRRRSIDVFHWYEMCDAVQAESYEIDHVEVSNFLLPLYFTSGAERGGRNDFLCRRHDGRTLRSFQVNPGGYIGYFNPSDPDDTDYAPDDLAKRRMQIKAQAQTTRRAVRYRALGRRVAHEMKKG